MAITATVIPAGTPPAEAATEPLPVVAPATGPTLATQVTAVTTLPLALHVGATEMPAQAPETPSSADRSTMVILRPPVDAGALSGAPTPATAAPAPPPVPPPSETGTLGERAVVIAATFAGLPYVYGGAYPGTGFDCSGYVQYVYGRLGVKLPRTTEAQYEATEHVPQASKEVGDLIFFGNPGAIYHVGIYAGGGRMWVAPHSGAVVQLETIWTTGYHVGRVRA
jgi:cell wall-associated NlpC family hydrolase